jgi:FkbM family methyltransferase
LKTRLKAFILEIITLGQYLRLSKLRSRKFIPGGSQVNIEIFFTLLSKKSHSITFIQIGANDGIKNDPIFSFVNRYHWKGILVEPLPKLFDKLIENYKSEFNLIFENVGISDLDGEMEFYYLPSEYNVPDWLQQIGTFDREAIEFNLSDFPELIYKIDIKKIPTITLAKLIERNRISKLDLLIIDAEGFEYRILKQIDNLEIKPSYILFEWGCMKASIQDALFNFLRKQYYELYSSGGDVLAVYRP